MLFLEFKRLRFFSRSQSFLTAVLTRCTVVCSVVCLKQLNVTSQGMAVANSTDNMNNSLFGIVPVNRSTLFYAETLP